MKKNKLNQLLIYSTIILLTGLIIYFFLDRKLYPILFTTVIVTLGINALSIFLNKENKEFEKNMILAVGFGVTVISWFVTGYINNENEIKRNKLISDEAMLQKKRELKTKFLIDAFFKIQNADTRHKETSADSYIYLKFIENAFSEIQLLGDSSLVRIARDFALSNGETNNNVLMAQLRNDLRRELGVSELPNTLEYNPFTYRIVSNKPVKDTLTSKDQIDLLIKINQLNQEFIK